MKTYSCEFTLKAPIERCFKAWTQDSEIAHWLGDAKAGNAAGEDYHLSSPLPYLSGRHKVIEFNANESLHLKHYIQGWPADLKVTFKKLNGTTQLTLTYSAETKNAPVSIEPLHQDQLFYFIGQSWSTSIKKLKSHLESNSPGVIIQPQNNDHTIHLSIDIQASPEKIWQALVDAEQLRQYTAGLTMEGTEVEPKVGGIYSYGWYPKGTPEDQLEDGPSKILVYEKNKLLTIKWHGGLKPSEVTYKLEAKDENTTRVHFKHGLLLGHTTGNVWSYRCGWAESLYGLKWFVEENEIESSWFKAQGQ